MQQDKKGSSPKTAGKRKQYLGIKVLLFFTLLAVLCFLSLLFFLRPSYSSTEKRTLTPFPSFSFRSLLSGTYFDQISLWFSDTFPFRDQMLTANAHMQGLYGFQSTELSGTPEEGEEIPTAPQTRPTAPAATQASTAPATTPEGPTEATTQNQSMIDGVTQSLGATLVAGDSGFEYYNFVRSVADQYTASVNRAASGLNGVSRVFDMLIPTSMDITLPEAIRKNLNSSDQKAAIDYMYGSLSTQVTPVPVFDTLKAHNGEYIYFRTDHHWTARGAYYGYREYAALAGMDPVPLNQFETKSYDGFLGAFYSETGKKPALGNHPDTVICYLPLQEVKMGYTDRSGKEITNWPVIADVSTWSASSKYSAFIGGDNPFAILENTEKSDGSACLVVKESFGNAFVPFLTSHYQYVYVIDYRYYNGTIVDCAKEHKVNDVLFLNNISATRNRSLMGRLEKIVD